MKKFHMIPQSKPFAICTVNDDVMRGKQGKGGVHVVKTNQVCCL